MSIIGLLSTNRYNCTIIAKNRLYNLYIRRVLFGINLKGLSIIRTKTQNLKYRAVFVGIFKWAVGRELFGGFCLFYEQTVVAYVQL